MALVRLIRYRTSPPQFATVDTDATIGAQVGVNLLGPDGQVVRWDQIANDAAPVPGSATDDAPANTDELEEGQFNFYFTADRVVQVVHALSTDDLDEGSNLYFTDERAAAAAPIQSLIAGENITLDVTDPTRPVINAVAGAGVAGHYDGGNAASVYTLAQHTFNGGGAGG